MDLVANGFAKKYEKEIREMNYDGTLVMPSSYAEMDEEEMQYTDSGWCIDTHWWGYNVYLTHKERKMLTDGQLVAGLVAGLLSMGVGAAVVAAVGGIIWNHDDGHGVRIRMTGPNYSYACFTGCYSLTKSQEKKIAKKNRII